MHVPQTFVPVFYSWWYIYVYLIFAQSLWNLSICVLEWGENVLVYHASVDKRPCCDGVGVWLG